MMSVTTKPEISVIVPCLNEQGNLEGAIEGVKMALGRSARFADYEILIFNDGSVDDTGPIAEELKKTDPRIKVIHNGRNMGFGYNYTEGVRLATKDYIIMVPGDNEIPAEAIEAIFRHAGSADVIVPYTANPGVRPLSRRVISRLFVALINTLFGLKLRYYNGTCVIKGSLLKKTPMTTWGFAYMAAILVRLLRSGASFVEVGVKIKPRDTGRSKAFRPKNILSVISAIMGLLWDVRVRERGRYSLQPKRVNIEG